MELNLLQQFLLSLSAICFGLVIAIQLVSGNKNLDDV